MHKFLGRVKFINPLGQKSAFGRFLSCVGKTYLVQPNLSLATLAPNDANSVTILNLSYFDVSYNLQKWLKLETQVSLQKGHFSLTVFL